MLYYIYQRNKVNVLIHVTILTTHSSLIIPEGYLSLLFIGVQIQVVLCYISLYQVYSVYRDFDALSKTVVKR